MAPRGEASELEMELARRAGSAERGVILRRLLLERAQDADEYLGPTAEAARHYLSFLETLSRR